MLSRVARRTLRTVPRTTLPQIRNSHSAPEGEPKFLQQVGEFYINLVILITQVFILTKPQMQPTTKQVCSPTLRFGFFYSD
jgi:hypothetical protein